MKNLLRYVPILLIVIVMTLCWHVPAFAAERPTFIVETSTPAPVAGEEVTITVSVQGASTMAFGVIQLAYEYDITKLELLEEHKNDAFIELSDRLLFTKAFDGQKGDYINYVFATPGQYVFTEKTTLFTMRFKVLTDKAGLIEQQLRHVVTLDVNSDTVYSPLEKYAADAKIIQTQLAVPKKVGGEIKGTIAAYNPKTKTRIELLQNGTLKYNKTLEPQSGSGYFEQAFRMTDFEEGVYDLRIVKAGHISYTVNGIEIKADSVIDLNAAGTIVLPCGDVNDDGAITQADIDEIRSVGNYYHAVGDNGVNAQCDLNGDGVCNVLDVAIARSAMRANAG